jgi:hypothetical protein
MKSGSNHKGHKGLEGRKEFKILILPLCPLWLYFLIENEGV